MLAFPLIHSTLVSLNKHLDTPRMAPIPPWADLPEELLSTIANFLTSNPLCILNFRSVCKSWFSSSPTIPFHLLSPPLPLIFPIPPSPFNPPGLPSDRRCLLSVTVIYLFRPPSGNPRFGPTSWVCFIDQFNSENLSIREPFSAISYSPPNYFPKTINLLDFHASELGRFHNLIELDGYDNGYNSSEMNRSKRKWWYQAALKVVLVSKMPAAVALSHRGMLGFVSLVDGGKESNEEWEIIHDGKGFRFDDIVDFKGMILGVDRRGRVYQIGLDRPFTIDPIVRTSSGGGGRRKRLVESLGVLYLVVRCNVSRTTKTEFKVYQLLFDEKKKKWGQVTEIGDRIFFFGLGFSLSVSTQQLGGSYRKNCIVYEKYSFRSYKGVTDDDDELVNKSGSSFHHIRVCHLEDVGHINPIESYPSYYEVLWPPPYWICPSARLFLEVDGVIDGVCMTVPDSLKDFFRTKSGYFGKEEENKFIDIMFFDGVGRRKENHKGISSVSESDHNKAFKSSQLASLLGLDREDCVYEAERVVEVSEIMAKKSIEVVEQNMEVVEGSRIRAEEIQEQLEKFHQLYHRLDSIPFTRSESGDFHDPSECSNWLTN